MLPLVESLRRMAMRQRGGSCPQQPTVLAARPVTPRASGRVIQKLREVVSRAITAYATSDDDETGLGGFSRSILRRLKLRVCLHVETKLIGEETRDRSTVELTLDRLQELAEEELDGRVMDALDGACNQQALMWGGLFAAVLALLR